MRHCRVPHRQTPAPKAQPRQHGQHSHSRLLARKLAALPALTPSVSEGTTAPLTTRGEAMGDDTSNQTNDLNKGCVRSETDTLGDTLGLDEATAKTLGPGKPAAAAPRTPSVSAAGPLQTSVANTVRSVLRDRAPVDAAGTGTSDRYAEVRELGRGGMGRVAEVTDAVLGRKVALKTLLGDDKGLRRRFDAEALVTAQLDHPGIPAIYELHTAADGKPSDTMHLVEGQALAKVLREATGYEARLRLLPAVVQVAQTLAFAHERGVVHRDIKPDNVIIGSHGEVALLDWGIAKVRGLGELQQGDATGQAVVVGDAGMTAHGSVLGTPADMAPEQARGEVANIDERTDVFALGAMLFHVLAGHGPYRGSSITDILHQAQQAQPPAIDKEAPQAPAALRAIVQRAMQADPALRHPTAGAFAADIEVALAQAMARPQSQGIARFAAATSWFGLVICVLMAMLASAAAPSIREVGYAAIGTLVFFVLGVVVAAVEWATSGSLQAFAHW